MAYLQRYFYKTLEPDRTYAATAFFAGLDHIATVAPSISCAILQELRDQARDLKLIASENYSSLAVQLAMGTLLTDKYAEGVAFHRFYAGCDNVDAIEAEAITEARLLFQADHAYVQPHSGADANLIALLAILSERVQGPALEKLGKKSLDELTPQESEEIRQQFVNQTLMGMDLGSGGHLTHGYRHNVSAKLLRSVSYGVDVRTGLLNYDRLAEQVREVRPLILLAGYSSYPRRLNFARLREIADSVDATLLVDMAHFAGLVAGGLFSDEEDPVPYADVITSTTHKTLRGPRGGLILCKNRFKEAINRGCPLVQGGPLPHVMAAKCVAFKEAGRAEFKRYAARVVENARVLAETLMREKCSVLTGGTDNHLVVVDVRSFGLTGRQAETALREARMTLNRNSIPEDPNGPWYTSGVRLGSAALTTLGMGPQEFQRIGKWIVQVLKGSRPEPSSKVKVTVAEKVLARVRTDVDELKKDFPLYPELDIEGIWTQKPVMGEAHG